MKCYECGNPEAQHVGSGLWLCKQCAKTTLANVFQRIRDNKEKKNG